VRLPTLPCSVVLRAKITVIALQPVPSVRPFSVVEVPSALVELVAAADWAEMRGAERRRKESRESILKEKWVYKLKRLGL